jgi:hypothetical protein
MRRSLSPPVGRLLRFLVAAALLAAFPDCRQAPPSPAPDPERPLALFDGHGDIGQVARTGSVAEDPEDGAVVIAGAGANMWFGADEGRFLWKRLKGDFIVSARAEFLGPGVEAHRKIGWMARASMEAGSPHVSAVVHGDGLTSLQYRRTPGANTEEIPFPFPGAEQIQLERRGDTYIMSAARFGEPYESQSVAEPGLGDEVLVERFGIVFRCRLAPRIEIEPEAVGRQRRDLSPRSQDSHADAGGLDGREAEELLPADRRRPGDLFPVLSVPDVEGERLDPLPPAEVLHDHGHVEALRPAEVVDP